MLSPVCHSWWWWTCLALSFLPYCIVLTRLLVRHMLNLGQVVQNKPCCNLWRPMTFRPERTTWWPQQCPNRAHFGIYLSFSATQASVSTAVSAGDNNSLPDTKESGKVALTASSSYPLLTFLNGVPFLAALLHPPLLRARLFNLKQTVISVPPSCETGHRLSLSVSSCPLHSSCFNVQMCPRLRSAYLSFPTSPCLSI